MGVNQNQSPTSTHHYTLQLFACYRNYCDIIIILLCFTYLPPPHFMEMASMETTGFSFPWIRCDMDITISKGQCSDMEKYFLVFHDPNAHIYASSKQTLLLHLYNPCISSFPTLSFRVRGEEGWVEVSFR